MNKSYYGVAVLILIAALWIAALCFPKESHPYNTRVGDSVCGEYGCD